MRPSVEFRLQCAHLSNSDCICNGPISQIQIAMRPSVNSDCICSGHICKFRLLCAHLSNLDCNAPICQIQIAFAMGPSVKFRLHLQWAHKSNSDCIFNGPISQIQIAFSMLPICPIPISMCQTCRI